MKAKVIEARDSPGEGIGEHMFEPHVNLGETAGVEEHRHLLLDLLYTTQTALMNTYVYKLPMHQITYRPIQTSTHRSTIYTRTC